MKQEKSGMILMRGRRIPYRWTRKKVKNLNLRVHRDGTVTVSTPPHVSLGRMESFLLANEDFIFRALARWDAMGQRLSEEYSLCDGGQIPILGKSFLLRVSQTIIFPFRMAISTVLPESSNSSITCLAFSSSINTLRIFLQTLYQV